MHLNAELVFLSHACGLFTARDHVLEVGPASVPSWFEQVALSCSWEYADIEENALGGGSIAHVMADEYTLPFADDRFDIVFSSQVIEHVRRPWVWLRDVARVCRPGGRVITIGPVSWPYHEAPIDCWRAYPDGMRAWHEDAGLVVELAVAESLEPRPTRRTYMGAGQIGHGRRAIRFKRFRRVLGWPTSVALDSVCVATKPTRD